MQVTVELLGGFGVTVDGRPVPDEAWAQRRATDLVGLLALAPGHRVLREQVVDALWSELPPDAGVANLHKAAHYARRALGDDEAVVLRGGNVALFPTAEVSTDAERFAEAARRAVAVADRAVCATAADLYTGELLPDRRYDESTVEHRDYLAQRYLELLRAAGRWREVVRIEPTDEAAHRALMRDHLARGDRHAAVRQFGRLRAVLARELEVRPAPETVALHREAVADLVRATAGPTGPLVGREVALARLGAALRSLSGRCGGVPLLVTGEAGIGKTRLCAAFLARARDAGFGVLQASAAESEGVPYGVLLDAARSAGPEPVAALPDEERAALEGAQAHPRQQLLAALGRLCRAAGGEQGTVLLVDDAHLADDDSVALLDTLVRATTGGCAVVLAFRPEDARPVLRELHTATLARSGAVEVALAALARDESHELVAALCGGGTPADAHDRIWQLAAGNPLFTTELAVALTREGTVEVPPTLTAAIAARLTPLPDELVERLRRVAVAVDTLDADEFSALTGLDEPTAFAALDRALAAGVLVVDGDGYRFRHALIAHDLAAGLPPHRRTEVHRTAAAALAAHGVRPARVARHLLAGDRPAEAVPYLVRAARDAESVSAYADALGHVDAALAVEPHRADLLGLRAELLLASGDPGAAPAFAAASRSAAGPDADLLRIRQAWALLVAGDVAGAAATLEGITAGQATRLPLALTSGMLAWFSGRFDDAETAAEQSMVLAAGAGEQARLLEAAFLQALVAHSGGRWAQQFRADLADPRLAGVLAGVLSDAHLCASEIYLFSEEPAGIAGAAARLRDQAARAGAARGEAFATTLLGEATLLGGDLDAAEELLLDGARRHRALRARGGEAVALHRLAELALAAGRPEAAPPLLDQALEAARLSPLSARHLLPRIFGTQVRIADDALAVLDEAAQCLVRPEEACAADRVPYLIPAATALARAGQSGTATGMLDTAQMLVGVVWRGGGSWPAAITESRADVAFASGDPATGADLLARAADGFDRAGQPLEAQRCAARAASV